MTEMMMTNLLSSLFKGVSGVAPPVAKSAIWPITVRSPIEMTSPFPEPSLHKVPKKARFLVSRGFSDVQSTIRNNGSHSPVSAELSTFISLDWMILMSAGILSPILTSTISPGTSFSAGIDFLFPPRMTMHCCGKKFLKPSMRASAFAPCM